MERKYRTTHRGIAAYLITQGYNIVRLQPGTNKVGRQVTYIEFDVDPTTGRQMGDTFFDGNVSGNLRQFYDAQGKVRQELYQAR